MVPPEPAMHHEQESAAADSRVEETGAVDASFHDRLGRAGGSAERTPRRSQVSPNGESRRRNGDRAPRGCCTSTTSGNHEQARAKNRARKQQVTAGTGRPKTTNRSNGSYERPANDCRQPRRGFSRADASKRKWANGEDNPSPSAQVRRPRRIWAGSAHARIRANFHAGLELSRARTRTVITTNLASPRSEHSSLATSFTSMDAHVTHIPI
jgi:hypothetical protein